MTVPMKLVRSVTLAIPAAAILALAPAAAPAQELPRAQVAFVAGPTQYDLSGVGWTQSYAVRVPVAVRPWLTVEPGLSYFDYRSQFGVDVSYLIPETQLQLTPFEGRFRPYLGGGVGLASAFSDADFDASLSLSAALGLRVDLLRGLGVVGELRVRSIDPWVGAGGEWGIGVLYRP